MATTGPYVFSPETISSSLKMVSGQATTVAAVDTIVTGLRQLVSVTVTADDDPSLTLADVSATVGNQAGAPAAGSFQLKTWKATSSADGTIIAATAFGKKVNWIAFGY